MKDAKDFLQELKTNARAQEIIAAMPIPKDEKEAAEGYVRLATELGYSLTAKEILAASWEMTKAQAKKNGRYPEQGFPGGNGSGQCRRRRERAAHPLRGHVQRRRMVLAERFLHRGLQIS